MRSVFVFPSGDRDRTRAVLDGLAGDGDPWVVAADDGSGPAPYLRIGAPDPDEWAPEELDAVAAGSGRAPDWMVTVDVSGRVPGGPEVVRLVLALLDDGGVALDDVSTGPWTAHDVRTGGFFTG